MIFETKRQLKQMGLRGCNNKYIARCLGWGEKTVRHYWIFLNMVDQVHQAQAQKRQQNRNRKSNGLRKKIEKVLSPLLDQNQKITMRQIGRALNTNTDYLHNYSDEEIKKYVQLILKKHNNKVTIRNG